MSLFPLAVRCVAVVAALSLTAVVAVAQPKVHVEPDTIDFGRMNQKETKQGDLAIVNRGDAPLEIKRVATDCGCTVAEPEVSVLQPGESTPLHITFNSKARQGDQIMTVKIFTNDPEAPEFHALVQAFVFSPLVTNPKSPALSFMQIRQGETPSRVYEFIAMDQPELRISLDRHDPDLFEAEVLHDYEGDPQRAALRVTVPADMPVGMQKDIMRVTTNVPAAPSKDIDVRVSVVLDLRIFPERVHYRYVKPEQQLERMYVRIAPVVRGNEFSITGAEIDLPGLVATVEEKHAGQEYFVWVSGQVLPKGDQQLVEAQGRMRGTLRIHTSLETQPLIEVPVIYMVRL